MSKHLFSKAVLVGALVVASASAFAVSPGGDGCGWGNMLFEGKASKPSHFSAAIVNGISGNQSFGITSGTNGCEVNGPLTYNGRSLTAMNGMLDNIAEDMAVGHGEALDTYATLLGIEGEDRARFAQVTRENFGAIFVQADVSSEQVLSATLDVMSRDAQLARYVKQPA